MNDVHINSGIGDINIKYNSKIEGYTIQMSYYVRS